MLQHTQSSYRPTVALVLAVLLTGFLLPGMSYAQDGRNDWVDEVLDLQEEIDLDAPLSQALWIGTHNSYNAYNDGYIIDQNQRWSIKEQLAKNVREIVFDVHHYDVISDADDQLILCHGGDNDVGCAVGDRKFKDGLKDITDFLDNNPNEVIILNIEPFLSGHIAQFNNKIENNILDYLYTPEDQAADGKAGSQDTSTCSFLNAGEVTKRDVLNAGKNVIIVTAKCEDSNRWTTRLFSGVEKLHHDHEANISNHAEEHKYEKTKSIGNCDDLSADETLFQSEIIRVFDSKLANGVNEFLADAEEDVTTWGDDNEMWHNDTLTYFLQAGAIPNYLDCGLNMFEMYNVNNNKRYKLVWSWDEADSRYPSGAGDYAKLAGTTDRFRDAAGSESHPFACRKMGASGNPAFNEWYVTSATGAFSQGEHTCLQESGGTHVFAVPRSKYELNELLASRNGATDLWLNYQKISGKWTADIGIRDADWTDSNNDGVHDQYENSAPTASIGGPYTVNEGGTIQLLSTSTDPDQDAATLTYEWDFDGNLSFDDASGIDPIFSAASLDGVVVVGIALRVTDDGGLSSDTSGVIQVRNVAPTIASITNDGPIIATESTVITVSASDPIDPITYAFDCDGDGSFEVGSQAANSISCLFVTAGSFVVNVQVSDDDGGVTVGSTSVTVLTPQQAIGDLQADVQALVDGGSLNAGQGNALNSKLDNAIKKLDMGQPDMAVNSLQSLLNQVNDFISEGVLSAAEGQVLIDEANRIISAIEAGAITGAAVDNNAAGTMAAQQIFLSLVVNGQ